MKSHPSLKSLKTALFLTLRFWNSSLRDGILPHMSMREFEGSCLLIAAMEQEQICRAGAQPAITLDTRYHQVMERCRDMSRAELRAEVSRLESSLAAAAPDASQ